MHVSQSELAPMHAAAVETEIARLAQTLARHPSSRIFAPLAEWYRRAGRISEAITLCEQGLRHHPGYLSGRLVLGRCYYDEGDLETAAGVFRQVVQAEPRNAVALRALGEIAEARGEGEEAVSWYRRALEAEPEDAEVRERLEAVLSSPVVEGGPGAGPAVGAADAAVAEAAPDEEIATVTLAEIYAEQGLHEKALGVYHRLLAEDPANAALREKAERLERMLADEQERLDAEAGSALGGFVAGELRPTEAEAPVGAGGEAPWAFLLVDEADVDPDELFAAAAAEAPAGPAAAAPGPEEPGARTALGWRDESAAPAAQEARSELEPPEEHGAPEAATAPEEPGLGRAAATAPRAPDAPPVPAAPLHAAEAPPAAASRSPAAARVEAGAVPAHGPAPSSGADGAPGPRRDEAAPVDDEDLKKFQEWLKSLK